MSERALREHIEIRPTGSYCVIDDDGFLVSPASAEKIQTQWRPVVDRVVQTHIDVLGYDNLVNVFIRGSVAKGEAINGISDLDTFAYCQNPDDAGDRSFAKLREDVARDFPYVNGIEIQIKPLALMQKEPELLLVSACVFCKPPVIPKLKPGIHLARNAPGIFERIVRRDSFEQDLKKENNPKRIEEYSVWLGKELLRVGSELTYDRSGRYSRDLYLCYRDFSEFYPEYEPWARRALELALNPTDDLTQLTELRLALQPLLVSEAVRLRIARESVDEK